MVGGVVVHRWCFGVHRRCVAVGVPLVVIGRVDDGVGMELFVVSAVEAVALLCVVNRGAGIELLLLRLVDLHLERTWLLAIEKERMLISSKVIYRRVRILYMEYQYSIHNRRNKKEWIHQVQIAGCLFAWPSFLLHDPLMLEGQWGAPFAN